MGAAKLPLHRCRLYTFVDTAYLDGRSPKAMTEQLCEGGSDIIQLRAKERTEADVAELAESLSPITEAAGVHLVINDHPAVARSLPSPFVHLGQEDFFDRGHRHVTDLFPDQPRPLIGLSTHAPGQYRRAVAAEADYVAVGPVYATATKPTAAPVTLNYVRWAAQNIALPWFAIGGIDPNNLEDVMNAGAERVCVVSAVLRHPNPMEACLAIRRRLPA